jgi:hypothetical protein
MNKRFIGGLILLLALISVFTLAYDHYLQKKEDLGFMGRLGRFPDSGYYMIDSESILDSLDRGEISVFTPLLENPHLVEEQTDISINWTQVDFLRIASAVGQLVWDDPMDLNDWSVYYLSFQSTCHENHSGFDFASITYFKATDVNGKRVYTTRLIEIDPYYGLISWGSGATYPRPILRRWEGIDLVESKVAADDALRIAEENGGKEARLQVENQCGIMISSSRYDNENWQLKYIMPPDVLSYNIDLYTGKHGVLKNDNK